MMTKNEATLTEKRFFEWHEDDVSVTLRNKSGSYGGGSEVFVIYSIRTQSEHCVQPTTNGCSKSKLSKES